MSTKSSKNELQEFCTMNKWNYPVYELISAGPEFSVRVTVRRENGSEIAAEATDVKKKGAEKEAARLALLKLQGETVVSTEIPNISCMDTATENNTDTTLLALDGIEIPITCNPNISSLLGSQKNYRSRLHEYCQHHGFKVKFSSGECFETSDIPRFSVMLSVDNRNVSGVGSSKKEANEEAARKMWFLLEQENSSSTNSNLIPPTILQTYPFTMGVQNPLNNEIVIDINDPKSEADILLYAPLIPPKLNTAQFIPTAQQDVNNLIPMDHLADLQKLLKNNNSDLDIHFTIIPTEGLLTESVYLFVHLFRKGELMPLYTGHGYGATEMDAKNAAIRNVMHLLPESFTS